MLIQRVDNSTIRICPRKRPDVKSDKVILRKHWLQVKTKQSKKNRKELLVNNMLIYASSDSMFVLLTTLGIRRFSEESSIFDGIRLKKKYFSATSNSAKSHQKQNTDPEITLEKMLGNKLACVYRYGC